MVLLTGMAGAIPGVLRLTTTGVQVLRQLFGLAWDCVGLLG